MSFSPAAAEENEDLERARQLGVELEKCLNGRVIDLGEEKAKGKVREQALKDACVVEKQALKDIHAAKEAGLREELKLTQTALEEAEEDAERSWYESPTMWFWTGMVVGIAGGFALAVGATWGVSQLTQNPLYPTLQPQE